MAKGQPAPKASELPGSFAGAAEGTGASDMAKSDLPGGFISMTAGADPEDWSVVKAGPSGDESATTAQMGNGQKMRTVTGRDQSPYSIE